MRTKIRITAGLPVGAAVTTILAGTTAATAATTIPVTPLTTSCGSWPGNGWAGHDVRPHAAHAGGRTVTFALVNQRWSDHSFSAIRSGYRSGDLTWVDRSYDTGAHGTQCGPINSRFSNDLSNLHNWMRACVRFKSTSFCTSWYYDKD